MLKLKLQQQAESAELDRGLIEERLVSAEADVEELTRQLYEANLVSSGWSIRGTIGVFEYEYRVYEYIYPNSSCGCAPPIPMR